MDQLATTTSFILSIVGTFSYLGIFIFFFAVGHFTPIPEEIVFLAIGYLAGERVFHLSAAFLVTVFSILAIDSVIYWLSRGKFGQWLKQKVNQTTLKRYIEAMHRHIFKTMVVLRLAIGLRFLGALVAGMTRVSWWRYLFYDFLIVSIYSMVLIMIGFHFHDFLMIAIHNVSFARHLIFILILIGIGLILAYEFSRFWRVKSEKNGSTDLLK